MPTRTELSIRFDQAAAEVRMAVIAAAKEFGLEENDLFLEFYARIAYDLALDVRNMIVRERLDRERVETEDAGMSSVTPADDTRDGPPI